MGNIQIIDFTPEDKRELSFGLLREWWINSTLILADNIGSDEAISHLRPYADNAAVASAINVKKLTGLPTGNAAELLGLWNGVVHDLMVHGKRHLWSCGPDLAFAEITNCTVGKRCWEICQWIDVMGAARGSYELNPEFETELVKCIWWGDDSCTFRTAKSGTDLSLPPLADIPIPEEPPEVLEFLEHAYLGELWVIVTRAFIDATDGEKASSQLEEGMRESGREIGEKYRERLLATGSDIGNFIHSLNALHDKKESCSFDGGIPNGEVSECPFSNSVPEICHEYEAFFNGICEAADPSCEFKYSRMMTKGDKTCHWTLSKKGMTAGKRELQPLDEDEMLKKLKWRLTNGEITPEQYRQLRDLLLEK